MITDRDTHIVYFSDLLKSDTRFTETCKRINKILDKYSIRYDFIKATKDIWARDYMPIQKDLNSFVQFRYEPSYLQDDLEHQSDPKIVCKANKINPTFSNINLDGGNVIKWYDKALITDRVFSENHKYTNKQKLISKIEKLLDIEVIVIPQIKSDFTGHADGLIRFFDNKTIIGNDLDFEYGYWVKGMKKILDKYGFEYINMPMFEYKDKKYPESAIGCYMNFLEIGNLIVFPIFETPKNKDQQAVDLIKSLYPQKQIETININEIANFGGLMNCITWNIKI